MDPSKVREVIYGIEQGVLSCERGPLISGLAIGQYFVTCAICIEYRHQVELPYQKPSIPEHCCIYS